MKKGWMVGLAVAGLISGTLWWMGEGWDVIRAVEPSAPLRKTYSATDSATPSVGCSVPPPVTEVHLECPVCQSKE